jgi:mxaJ protein
MSSPFRKAALILAVGLAAAGVAAVARRSIVPEHATPRSASSLTRPDTKVLRVCSDPNNLPFSNERRQGFENELASMLARDMGARLEYTWWAQRRGFFRNTLNAGACDVVMGVPTSFELSWTTRPYYRSTYVFVTRRASRFNIRSFDDPQLQKLTIGVQLIGDDGANTPPAHALAARGIVRKVRGYPVYGNYSQPNPPARIIDAVANGDIDVAVAWGPMAGYFATREPAALDITPVSPQVDLPFLPFVFDIGMGVRRGDTARRDLLNRFIEVHQPEITRLLARYGVPTL